MRVNPISPIQPTVFNGNMNREQRREFEKMLKKQEKKKEKVENGKHRRH